MAKAAILTLLVIIFSLLFLLFTLMGRKKAAHTYSRACDLEKAGRYEDACYTFAMAARQGANSAECRTRIHSIWQNEGPFDFSEQMKIANREYLGDGNGHGEGYHENIVDYIKRTVS